MRDMTAGELHSIYDKQQCPHCRSQSFRDGPRGGMMMNIDCAGCGMKFNVSQSEQLRIGQILMEPLGYVPPPNPQEQTQGINAPSVTSEAQHPRQNKTERMALMICAIALALACLGLTLYYVSTGSQMIRTFAGHIPILSTIAITAAAAAALGLAAKARAPKVLLTAESGVK